MVSFRKMVDGSLRRKIQLVTSCRFVKKQTHLLHTTSQKPAEILRAAERQKKVDFALPL